MLKMYLLVLKLVAVVIFLFVFNLEVINAGIPHSHSSSLNKEREKDGSYSPKDKNHFSDSGEHDNEFDHEAILGSVKEAEEFDHLPPEEAKRRLAILLKKIDNDGNEFISRNELKAWILRSFRMLSEEEANERLEDVDENDDNKVSWDEYVADTYGQEENELSLDKEDLQLMEDDRKLWEAADFDHNGFLEDEEWMAFSHPEENPTMLPHILEQTLNNKDLNKDGTIDFQEFVGKDGSDKNKEWLLSEKEKFDHEFDKNGDGKLMGNEILSWIVPSNDDIAEEEVTHLFSASDDDHDDLLSFDEIIEHHDIFVGSEATDYGEHLHNIHNFKDEL